MKLRPYFLAAALGLALLGGCANQPPVPDWQMTADSTAQRGIAAFLQGNQRVEKLEFERARAATARTGDPVLLARLELLHCAAQVASLKLGPCAAFEALRPDAGAPEQAYADYLAGHVTASDARQIALLPPAQHSVASAANPAAALAALQAIADPLSRLVAAGVLLQSKSAQAAGDAPEVARLQRRIAIVESGGTTP